MKTHLIICNESDYLRAHLTFIAGKPVPEGPAQYGLKHRITSTLKKWFVRWLPT